MLKIQTWVQNSNFSKIFDAVTLHFENQFEVSYCKLQGSNPRLVINMVMGYIEEVQPERIMFGCRGYVRLPESEDQTHDIKTFKNQCRLVKHKKCDSCKKELDNKREERRKSVIKTENENRN